MNPAHRHVACFLLLVSACSPAPTAPEIVADPVAPGTPLRFTGEIVLTGALANATEGAIVVAVRRADDSRDLWRRSYEIADPWWSVRPGARSLPFGLSIADAIVVPSPDLSSTMEVVARFDPDGNPETVESGTIQSVVRARTGATDLVLTLGRARGGARGGPDITRTANDPIRQPSDGDR